MFRAIQLPRGDFPMYPNYYCLFTYLLRTYVHRTNETLNESNEIAGLQKRLELSGREVLLLQNELDNKISNMSDRTLEMGQVQ